MVLMVAASNSARISNLVGNCRITKARIRDRNSLAAFSVKVTATISRGDKFLSRR